ncbi:MAG: ATP-dependent DNA helicase RecG [Planctomycetes bacterium]|nr:ATP-dependent DNA helicase RecG [Planctomycetota bacterium]
MPLRGDSPIQYIKGVGPVKAGWFAEVGLRTVAELLEYYPFRYESEKGECELADVSPGMSVTVRGEVLRVRRRSQHLHCRICDGTGECTLRWFSAQYAPRWLEPGVLVVATGRAQLYQDELEIVQPRVQVFRPGNVILTQQRGARNVGVYRGTAQLKSSTIRRAVLQVLEQAVLPVDELLPPQLVRKHGLPQRAAAVRQMHCPDSAAELERARPRLVYEEFLLMELAIALRRYQLVSLQTGQKLHFTAEIDRRIRDRFPFELTPSQTTVVNEIARDLESGRPMTRLLQGDVGSGKTVVALYACLVAIANGCQAAIMAPTEILAQQHYDNIERYLAGSRVRRTLLLGGQPKQARTAALRSIEAGAVDLVVGTQALIQKDVAFAQLALVVVDEQHKFGVLQRARFRTKGPLPHYLVMTATPIPRTLSMTVFGDLDVSIIRHAPPGRGQITTKIVTRQQRKVVLDYVRGRLEKGEQAYVVCPVIGKSDDDPETQSGMRKRAALASARQMHQDLVDGAWQGLEIGLLHGALKADDKRATVEAFVAGKLHALVATTVVEVGVDVPNATIMVVEHAERYGLSQLHQLRGRIGRGRKDSLCVLITHERGAKAAERLAVMADTTDGFKIAEADLRQRGPGELLGTRQHGLPELHVGDIVNDFALLEQARQDAFEIIARDPRLAQPQHKRMIPALKRMFGNKLALIDAA